MKNRVYTLKEKKGTKELHLFESVLTPNGCKSKVLSICKKMKSSDGVSDIFACENEEFARAKSAKIGREVCGTCISHLYTSY